MNSDDLKMAYIIKDGKDGDIVIVGSPYDYVRKRCIQKGGEDNGPCCLRRFFGRVGPIINAEYGISLENVKITDYGNIHFQEQNQNSSTPEKCITKISQEILQLLRSNKIPFVLGGSKESLYGSAKAFQKRYPNSKHILISGKPNLKRPFDSDKLTSDSILTLLNKDYPNTVTLFGAHKNHFPKSYNSDQFDQISYQSIRTTQIVENNESHTQAGFVLNSFLTKLKDTEAIHVSLTVEAIERFRGTRDVLSAGITVQEIIQIFFILGTNKRVSLVDISQFNPSVEDYESSLLLVNLLYYFLLGWTKRNKN